MDTYIIIAQYYGKSFISRLIRWRTWSKVSHTAALSVDEKYVYEAWHRGGAQKSPWDNQPHTKGTKVDLFKVYCTQEEADRFYNYLESHMGTKYNFKAIIGFIFRIKWMSKAAMFCSQLVFKAGLHMPRKFLKRIDPFKVSPGHIHTSPELEFYKTVYTP